MKRWTNEEVETIKAEYHTSTINEIAAKINRSRAAVYVKANSLDIRKVLRKPKVEQVAES